MELLDLASHITCECDGAEQGVFSLARIEAGVLYDDRYIRFNETGKISVARDRLRITEIVEADMPCSPSRHQEVIRPDRFTIAIKHRDANTRVLIGRIQQANGFVTRHLWRRPMAVAWNIALCYGPLSASDSFHVDDR